MCVCVCVIFFFIYEFCFIEVRNTPHSSKLQNWSLTIRSFKIISRLIVTLCFFFLPSLKNHPLSLNYI